MSLQMISNGQAMALGAAWKQHIASRAAAKAAAALQEMHSQGQAGAAVKAVLSDLAASCELLDAACLSCASACASLAKYTRLGALW